MLSIIISYKKYIELNATCDKLRSDSYNKIEQGGWHLSYFGDANFIKNKLENFAHQEYNSDNFTNTSKIDYRIKNGLDLFDRQSWDEASNMTKITIDNNKYLPPFYETYLSSFYT